MPVSALSLSKKIEERYDYVQTLYPKDPAVRLLQQQVLTEMHAPKEATQIMTTLHRLQRFELAGKLEMLDNQAIATALYDPRFISWNKYAGLPVAKERKVHLGELLYSAGKITQTSTLLQGFDYARDVAESVLDQCIQNGHDVDVWIEDRPFQNRLLNHADEKIARACGEYWAGRYEGFERRIPLISNHASVAFADPLPPENMRAIEHAAFLTTRAKNKFATQEFTLTVLPTPQDAETDGYAYEDYVETGFNMCAVDIEKIDAAHQVFIAKLNAGTTLRITNDDGTDITFDIEGMGFANSLMERNLPGTEVFSAPKKDGVNGRIVAKGKFLPFNDHRLIEDIELELRDGEIVNYSAKSGGQYLRETIETDAGSHYLGEVAFGTNPALQRHVSNPLWVEKIGCSFHVAIGRALVRADAHTDNGNRSGVHWDITTMLAGKNGRIELDGEVVMENGRYCDKRLAYLNGVAAKLENRPC